MKLSELQAHASGLPPSRSLPSTGSPTSTGGFEDIGEQLLAIREAALIRNSSSVRPIDPRLIELTRRGMAAGGSEQVLADGGFLIAPAWTNQILTRMSDVGELFSRCFRATTTSSNYIYPTYSETTRAGSLFGGVKIFLESEADQLTASKPAFERHELVTRKHTGLIYLTSEFGEDSESLGSWAPFAFAEAMNFALENQIINGTGAGQMLGVLNGPGTIMAAKEGSQAAGTVVSENIDAMLSRLYPPSRKTAIWLYNSELLPSLRKLSTVVGDAGSESRLWQWASGTDEFDRLAGMPALPCEYCAAPGALGDIILVDLSRYLLVLRSLIQTAVSVHVRFLTDELAYRFTLRAAGGPIDGDVLIPANGNLTKSSAITLAART